jgi:hypothetical protein
MFSIILKQILKHKIVLLFFILFWIVSGILIYQHKFKILAFLYHITSDLPSIGESKPQKAYYDYFLPALKILNQNNVNLAIMENFCPQKIHSSLIEDKEYEWDFLKKYNFFYFDQSYISKKSYTYWEEKKPYVIEALLYLKEAIKYSYEIPSDITQDKKNILIPYLIQQSYNAICLPEEARIYWQNYIEFIENHIYIDKKIDKNNLSFPAEKDLYLLNELINNPRYHFAIHQYIGKTVPFSLIENCPEKVFICSHVEEVNEYLNKLIFTKSLENVYDEFLNHARLYIIFYHKLHHPDFLYRALDRYKGAMDQPQTEVDAYLESAYVFLLLNQPENSLKLLLQFKEIKPKNFIQEPFYYRLIYQTLTELQRYKEADCFKTQYIDSADCKRIRSNF